jgi:hypothetical protein
MAFLLLEKYGFQTLELQTSLEQMPKLCLLAAACLTYLPDQPEDRRRQELDGWQQFLDVKDTFSLKRFDYICFYE